MAAVNSTKMSVMSLNAFSFPVLHSSYEWKTFLRCKYIGKERAWSNILCSQEFNTKQWNTESGMPTCPAPVAAPKKCTPPNLGKGDMSQLLEPNFPEHCAKWERSGRNVPPDQPQVRGVYTWISAPRAIYNNRKLMRNGWVLTVWIMIKSLGIVYWTLQFFCQSLLCIPRLKIVRWNLSKININFSGTVWYCCEQTIFFADMSVKF